MLRYLLLAALAAGLAPGQGNGQAKAKAAGETAPPEAEGPKVVYPFFRDAETKLILDFYRPGSGHLPPGLARRGAELSAGIQKQLRITGTLPAGLEKKFEPFPSELDRRLTAVPAGYTRGVCGTTALLVQEGTHLIVDVIDLVRK